MDFDLSGKRALVTGATGFIGGRLAERLARDGVGVRALVRNFTKAARLARLDVEMVPGDASVEADVDRAAGGCDVAFHCAYGNSGSPEDQRRGTLESTRFLLDAALRHGIQRVVNVSTVAVYGETPDGDLDESAPRRTFGDVYSSSKAEAEELCLRYAREKGLGVSTVQPTIVYGPFGPAWTVRILDDLKRWRVELVDGGRGLCNAVYVDDVVQAMLLAARREAAVGEVFLVSGPGPVTWKEFFARHERILGIESTIELSLEEATRRFEARGKRRSVFREARAVLSEEVSARRRLRRSAEVEATLGALRLVVPQGLRRRLKARITGAGRPAPPNGPAAADEKPVQLLPPAVLRMQAAKTRARIDKAARLLGYRPAFDFERGMQRVEAWARWAGIAPEGPPART